jgi:hypothetical protein
MLMAKPGNFLILKGLLKTLEADKSLVSALSKDMEAVAKELEAFGGIVSKEGKQLKTAEEIILAVKENKIAPAELGRFNVTLFKETGNAKISDALAKDIASSPTFVSKYSKKTRSEVVAALEAKGFSKVQANNQVVKFNVSYSSQLNPIERLWAIAKRQFVKDCVTDVDFKQQEEIKAFLKRKYLKHRQRHSRSMFSPV